MIIFVGVSGAGKGTQSELLARKVGYAYLATGDMLRKYATPAQKARMLSGELLSDDEIIVLIDEALQRQPNPNQVILDGFPRTVVQTRWLLAKVSSAHYAIEAVVHLEVTPKIVLARLQARGREDDTKEAIASRLSWYQQHTVPVVELFRSQHVTVLDLDGNDAPEQVHQHIMAGLKGRIENLKVL